MKSLSFLIFSALFALFQSNGLAQSAEIEGKVIARDKSPMPGVHVFVDELHGAITNEHGIFSFSMPVGAYQLSARSLGFLEFSKSFVLTSDGIYLSITLEPKLEELSDVVISAGKASERRKDVVVSMEVIKPDLIEIVPVTNMEEAMRIIPGVNVADGQVSIRSGAGYSYGAGSRVMVLFDGLPILSADAGDVKWTLLPLENLEQIEVIKGASSSLYGTGALNGIINFIPAWPNPESKTKLSLVQGAYFSPQRKETKWWGKDTRMYQAYSISDSRQIDRLDIISEFSYFSDDGYRTYNDENRFNAHMKLRYRPESIEGLHLGIGTLFSDQSKREFFFWRNASEGIYMQDSANATLTQSQRFAIDPFITYYRNGWQQSIKSRFFYNKNDVSGESMDNEFNSLFVEYLLNKTFIKDWRFLSGVHYSNANIYSNLYENHTSGNLALFVQLEKKFFDRVRVSAGLRYETFRLDSNREATKPLSRIGVNYQLSQTGNLRASYGQGFRYPTVAEKFTQTQLSGLRVMPNPHILPESGWNVELGYRQEFRVYSALGYIDIAFFQTEYHQMMEYAFGVIDSITYLPIHDIAQMGFHPLGFQSQNVGQARINGFEISTGMQGFIGPAKIQLLAGYTYTLPVDLNTDSVYQSQKSTETNILKYRYKHAVNLSSQISYRKLAFGYTLLYNSRIEAIDRFFELGLVLPGLKNYREEFDNGVLNMDLSVSYQLNSRFGLAIMLKNLANNEYMIRPGDIGAPRNIMLKLTAEI